MLHIGSFDIEANVSKYFLIEYDVQLTFKRKRHFVGKFAILEQATLELDIDMLPRRCSPV